MSRLQKKCFIASAGLHSLLLVILFVGPAFQSSKRSLDDARILDFIPLQTTDAKVSGGGDPKAQPPPMVQTPQPHQPQPQPPPAVPKQQKEVEPPKEIVKESKTDPESLEIGKTKKPAIDPTKVVKNPNLRKKQPTAPPKEDTAAQEQENAKRDLVRQFTRSVGNLARDMSDSTSIRLVGPGGGGVPYANFLAAVKTVYTRAWILPDGSTDDDATAVASVTIARDGSVISARIIQFSRNGPVDRSVQATLERVRFAAPLPPDAKEDQRTVTINFNAQAKRALG